MADVEETPNQRQARLRREKREKKILSGGASRLDKITSLSGRPADVPVSDSPSATPNNQPSPTSPPQNLPNNAAPAPRPSEPSQQEIEASMRQLLRGSEPASLNGTGAQRQAEQQDPMLQLLQQMMGSNMPPTADGSLPQGQSPFENLPPGLASLLGGMGNPNQSQAEPQPPPAKEVYIWKILHALFSLILGGYILYTYTSFTGSLTSRLGLPPLQGLSADEDLSPSAAGPRGGQALPLFWLFITAELGLQGGRYLLDGGREEEGMIKTVSGFLPPPWGERVRLVGRYVGIWGVVAQDALVVVFLVGAVSWWRGGGTALEV